MNPLNSTIHEIYSNSGVSYPILMSCHFIVNLKLFFCYLHLFSQSISPYETTSMVFPKIKYRVSHPLWIINREISLFFRCEKGSLDFWISIALRRIKCGLSHDQISQFEPYISPKFGEQPLFLNVFVQIPCSSLNTEISWKSCMV